MGLVFRVCVGEMCDVTLEVCMAAIQPYHGSVIQCLHFACVVGGGDVVSYVMT